MKVPYFGQLFIPCNLLGQEHRWVRLEKYTYSTGAKFKEAIHEVWWCSTCHTEYAYDVSNEAARALEIADFNRRSK